MDVKTHSAREVAVKGEINIFPPHLLSSVSIHSVNRRHAYVGLGGQND